MIIKCVGGLITGRCCFADYNINPKFLRDILILIKLDIRFKNLNSEISDFIDQKSEEWTFLNHLKWKLAVDSCADLIIFILCTNHEKNFNSSKEN